MYGHMHRRPAYLIQSEADEYLHKKGEIEPLREEVTRCMLCGKCLLVCPRGVNTRNVVAVAAEAIRKLERNEL